MAGASLAQYPAQRPTMRPNDYSRVNRLSSDLTMRPWNTKAIG
jgi:hypothetical protein